MKKRPNIMLLVAEDTGRHQGCYGDPVNCTPAVDSIAAAGTRYTNAFSTAPVCAPSRSAMMMGKTAFSQGSHHMRSMLKHPPKLFTEALRESGYYVNWTNKTDFNFEPPSSFADDCSSWYDDLASGKLKDRPWLLYRNYEISHESKMWPDAWGDAVAPHLTESDRVDPARVPVPPYLADTPEIRADIARYYESLIAQNKGIAQALDALEKSGERDNTIIFYFSDHGRGLLREKRWMYDAGIHLPLIVSAPGITTPGSVSDELVSWLDLSKTILSLCDAKPIDGAQGRIFLGPDTQPEPKYVFAGRDRMDEVFDRVRVARSRKYHYIRNDFPQLPWASRQQYMEKQITTQQMRELNAKGQLNAAQANWFSTEKPAEEFFDIQQDPHCLNNLASAPSVGKELAAHRKALAEFLDQTGDLGQRPEADLIAEGIVENKLPEYYERVAPLPENYRIGDLVEAPVEMPK
ncbi:sulfatase family protein [Cerasicoccus fimbriatus]|uniref:sulfatase family protein n=1 Tax=Cerasicoccus fimbriatus TaxID=3014554 RepID=UPI0022B5CEC0|nr:sulfatase [Cerasicoccus sp. TK19100]